MKTISIMNCGCMKYGKKEMKKDMVKSCHSCYEKKCCDTKKSWGNDSVEHVCGCECDLKCKSHYTELCHKGYNAHRHYCQNKHYIKNYVKDHMCHCH